MSVSTFPSRAIENDDLSKLEGQWIIVSYEEDGLKWDAQQVNRLASLTIDGNQYFWSVPVRSGRISLDATKNPKLIDYTIASGEDVGKVHRAIYEIVDDTWTDCIAPIGKPRPREFSAPQGSGYMLVVYRRA